jgi:hypothetical protein
MVILVDLFVVAFLTWRATAKKATLWGRARLIYGWVAILAFYHGTIYIIALFLPPTQGNLLIVDMLHPVVVLYVLNPLLIALIHWRGGRLL